jgi:prevent-host-death family protein
MPIKVFNLVSKEYTMKQVTSVGSYEAKTHLPQLLRQVEAGHVVEITVRGRVVARLTSATADQHREVAADKMRQFMRAQQIGGAGANMDLREMINEGRA